MRIAPREEIKFLKAAAVGLVAVVEAAGNEGGKAAGKAAG
jgi:hypothetical protein